MKGFYNRVCPLCQQNVEIDQPASFYLFPLHPSHPRLFSQDDWHISPTRNIQVPNLSVTSQESYPALEYNKLSFVIHRRCHALTGNLAPLNLRFLIDVVEPTFPRHACPPGSGSSMDGAFLNRLASL